MIDADCANVLRIDPFVTNRAVFELYRCGIDLEAVRTVVWENLREVYGFDG